METHHLALLEELRLARDRVQHSGISSARAFRLFSNLIMQKKATSDYYAPARALPESK